MSHLVKCAHADTCKKRCRHKKWHKPVRTTKGARTCSSRFYCKRLVNFTHCNSSYQERDRNKTREQMPMYQRNQISV